MRFAKIFTRPRLTALQRRARSDRDAHALAIAERSNHERRGFTLVELLVVVMIMVILLGIAIPVIKPALEDRKIREASRQLNAFIRAAQSRAAETNRSVGVWFARTDDTNPNICYQLYFAETPPPYVGESTASALVQLTNVQSTFPANPNAPPWLRRASLSDAFALWVRWDPTNAATEPLVQRGDRIRFNYTGPDYVIYDIYTTDPLTSNPQPPQPNDLYTDPAPGQGEIIFGPAPTDIHAINHPPTVAGGPIFPGAKFQITRKPQRSSAGSLSLPNTTAVILSLSGFNGIIVRQNNQLTDDRNEFDSTFASTQAGITSPVVVMFRPDGSVERVYYGDSALGVLPDAPIHFLVGRAEVDERLDPEMQNPQAQPPFAPPNSETLTPPASDDWLLWQNLNDMANLWVIVGERTGTITTSAMQDWRPLYDQNNPNRNTLVQKTRDARSLAATGLSVGGK